jgi:hypothetical protein
VGVIVATTTAEGLAGSIRAVSVLSPDPAAFSAIRTRFDWATEAARLLRYYEDVTPGRPT